MKENYETAIVYYGKLGIKGNSNLGKIINQAA